MPAWSLPCSPPSVGCTWSRWVTNEGCQHPPSISTQVTVTPSQNPLWRKGAEAAVGQEIRSGLGAPEVLLPRWTLSPAPDGGAASRSQKSVPAAALKSPVICTVCKARGPRHWAAPSCRPPVLFHVWLLHFQGPGQGRGACTSKAPIPLPPLRFVLSHCSVCRTGL